MKYIISESRLGDFIYEYLTKNYYPDYGWGPDFLYRKDIEKFGFHDFEVNDKKAYAYRGKGRKELLVRTWIADELTSLFGDSWKPVFAKWFEDNTSLPVGEVTVWVMD